MTELPLRKFGFLFGIVFALLALWVRGYSPAAALLGAGSIAFIAVTLTRPAWLSVPARLWMRLGELLHRVVSPLVLGAMYALLIVPTGLLRRWLGGDPLQRRFDATRASYWTPCAPRARSVDDFRQQF